MTKQTEISWLLFSVIIIIDGSKSLERCSITNGKLPAEHALRGHLFNVEKWYTWPTSLVKRGDVYQSQGQFRRNDKRDISSENGVTLSGFVKLLNVVAKTRDLFVAVCCFSRYRLIFRVNNYRLRGSSLLDFLSPADKHTRFSLIKNSDRRHRGASSRNF